MTDSRQHYKPMGSVGTETVDNENGVPVQYAIHCKGMATAYTLAFRAEIGFVVYGTETEKSIAGGYEKSGFIARSIH